MDSYDRNKMMSKIILRPIFFWNAITQYTSTVQRYEKTTPNYNLETDI